MTRNRHITFGVQAGMDEIQPAAIRDEGYDPDDPDVIAALDRVRAELEHWFNPNLLNLAGGRGLQPCSSRR